MGFSKLELWGLDSGLLILSSDNNCFIGAER